MYAACHSHVHSHPSLAVNSPAGVLDKSNIGEHGLADITAETVRVPAVIHGLNHTPNYKLSCGNMRDTIHN